MRWHGVVTPSAHRTASQKPAQGKIKTAAQAVNGQGLMRVFGTGRLEAAGRARGCHQQRRDKPTISRDCSQCGHQCRGAKPPAYDLNHGRSLFWFGSLPGLGLEVLSSLRRRLSAPARSSALSVIQSSAPAPLRAITTIATPAGSIARSFSR
jgi:hypothetical protein